LAKLFLPNPSPGVTLSLEVFFFSQTSDRRLADRQPPASSRHFHQGNPLLQRPLGAQFLPPPLPIRVTLRASCSLDPLLFLCVDPFSGGDYLTSANSKLRGCSYAPPFGQLSSARVSYSSNVSTAVFEESAPSFLLLLTRSLGSSPPPQRCLQDFVSGGSYVAGVSSLMTGRVFFFPPLRACSLHFSVNPPFYLPSRKLCSNIFLLTFHPLRYFITSEVVCTPFEGDSPILRFFVHW